MPQTPPLDDDFPEPPRLRRLRLLVTALIVVLIAAVLIVVASLVIKIGEIGAVGSPEEAGPQPVTAESIHLPADAAITAAGEGQGTLLLTVRRTDASEALLRYDAKTGALLSETELIRD